MVKTFSACAEAAVFVAVAMAPFVPLGMQRRAQDVLASCGQRHFLPPVELACLAQANWRRDAGAPTDAIPARPVRVPAEPGAGFAEPAESGAVLDF